MALPKYYNKGLISIANGATTFTGKDTAWLNLVKADDRLALQNLSPRIASIESNGSGTLAEAWAGTTVVDGAYEIQIVYDGPEFQLRTRELLEQLNVLETSGRGIVQKFSTTTTDADPGAGYFRLNGLPSVATAAYLDNQDIEEADITAEVDSWDDHTSTIRGKLWLRSIAVPATFYAFNVTGSVVDGTGYRKLTLAYVGGAGTLAADDEVMLFFVPKGDKGDTGNAGGITLTFDDPTAAGDPGAGKFRLNHATHASATAGYFDNADANAADITALLDSWDDSTATIKGTLTIISKADAAIWRVFNVTGSVVDSTGYRTVTLAYVSGAGTLADETSCAIFFSRSGDNGADGADGANGTNGASALTVVRVVDTTGAAVATAYEAGDVIDGVTLVQGDLILRATSGGNSADGVYVAPAAAAGAAARHASFDTYDEHPGNYFSVMEGAVYADTTWRCTSDKGGTLGTTALTFEDTTVPQATASTPGIVELATLAEAQLGTDADRAIVASVLAGLIGGKFHSLAPDDTAVSVGLGGASRVGFGFASVNNTGTWVLFRWETVGNTLEQIAIGSNSANISLLSGATLTGTTWTDGKFNVAIASNSSQITAENRLGGQQIITLIVVGAG